jgi:putative toxin-antitoxin system antitoxin component (TIGR02293 family)
MSQPASYARRKLKQRADTWRTLMTSRSPLEKLYAIDPLDRIRLVKEGAPADLVTFLVDDMAITKDRLYTIAGVARATIDRKLRSGTRLNQDESERIIGVARLVGQAGQIVAESGDAKRFDAGKWVAAWLDRPSSALGGRKPADLMDTSDGRELVSDLLSQMQSGAYA